MATFYKRGKTWSYSMYVGFDADGKRKKKGKGGFRTKKDAENAASEVSLELANGTYIQEKDVTFDDFCKEWLRIYTPTVKMKTVESRITLINNLKYYFSNVKLKDINKIKYQNMLMDLSKRGYSKNTITGVHSTAQMIIKKAIKLDVIRNDVTQYAELPKKAITLEEAENQIPKYLEKKELITFLDKVRSFGLGYDYLIFLTLAYTGMRVGELCVLKWDDIDFENNTINISKTYYAVNGNGLKYILVPPKTKMSRRKIKVTKKVIEEFGKYKLLQKLEKEYYNKKYTDREWHDENFVFCCKRNGGYPLRQERVESKMKKFLKLAQINISLTPHSLRHTHTSLLAEADVRLETIMERLGHSDDKTTRAVYLHVTKNMKTEAVDKFDDFMDRE
jgi:integrase